MLALELWSGLRCATGSALLGEIAAGDLVGPVRERRAVDAAWSLTLTLLDTARVLGVLRERQVLAAYATPGDPAAFDEWIVTHVRRRKVGGVGVALLECASPAILLARVGVIYDLASDGQPVFAGGTEPLPPRAILEGYIAGALPVGRVSPAPAWVSIGTIEPTAAVGVSWTTPPTPHEVIEQVVTATRRAGGRAEFQFRRVGTTGYAIDLLTQIGSTAATAQLSTGTVLRELEVATSPEEHATAGVFLGAPDERGEPTSVAANVWTVASVDTFAGTAVLADPESGASPVYADGCCDGLHIYRQSTGVLYAITGSDAAAGTVTAPTAFGGTIAAGERVELRADATGARVVTLTHPAGIATYGRQVARLVRSEIGGALNYVPNATLRSWSGGAVAAPDGYGAATRTPVRATRTDTASGYAVQLRADATEQFVDTLAAGATTLWVGADLRAVLTVGDGLRIADYAGGSTYINAEDVTITALGDTPDGSGRYEVTFPPTTSARSAGFVARPTRVGTYPGPLTRGDGVLSLTFTPPASGIYSVAALLWSPVLDGTTAGVRLTVDGTPAWASTLRQWTQLAVLSVACTAAVPVAIDVTYVSRGASLWATTAEATAFVQAVGIYAGADVPEQIRDGAGGTAAWIALGQHLVDCWEPPRAVRVTLSDRARAAAVAESPASEGVWTHAQLTLGAAAEAEDADGDALIAPVTGRILVLERDLRDPYDTAADIATRQVRLSRLLA